MPLPADHRQFMDRALPVFAADDRLLGVAAAGSWITGTMDAYSDLDLLLVARPDAYDDVLRGRRALAGRLGTLLAAFTGEHVGEPRLLICLYDAPLLHVDLKVVHIDDLAHRIEDPVILWERDRALSDATRATPAVHPMPDPQWVEDRFWIWVHYAALRLGRGELFEVIDFLAYLRGTVLGPMALVRRGHLPRGVRRLETLVPEDAADFRATLATHDLARPARRPSSRRSRCIAGSAPRRTRRACAPTPPRRRQRSGTCSRWSLRADAPQLFRRRTARSSTALEPATLFASGAGGRRGRAPRRGRQRSFGRTGGTRRPGRLDPEGEPMPACSLPSGPGPREQTQGRSGQYIRGTFEKHAPAFRPRPSVFTADRSGDGRRRRGARSYPFAG